LGNECVTTGRFLENGDDKSCQFIATELHGQRSFAVSPPVYHVAEAEAKERRQFAEAQPRRDAVVERDFDGFVWLCVGVMTDAAEQIRGAADHGRQNPFQTDAVFNAELHHQKHVGDDLSQSAVQQTSYITRKCVKRLLQYELNYIYINMVNTNKIEEI